MTPRALATGVIRSQVLGLLCLQMQGTGVRSLIQEDPICRGATKPVRHNYRAWALEPGSHNYGACVPRACAPQQEKAPQ